jgi:predicted DCC family thiol-disulfide oxidoreductase YuxK
VIASAGHATVLFDGVCNLCNATVRFIIRRDREDRFRFAPLQGPAAQALLERVGEGTPGTRSGHRVFEDERHEGPTSIVLVEGSRVFRRSAAALRIALHLSGAWPLLYALILVPRFARDAAYDFIARHRYRWFGRRDACMVPTQELGEKFLV